MKILRILPKHEFTYEQLAVEVERALRADARFPTIGHLDLRTLRQPDLASLLAGVIGALAVRYQLSSSLRLVAVLLGILQAFEIVLQVIEETHASFRIG